MELDFVGVQPVCLINQKPANLIAKHAQHGGGVFDRHLECAYDPASVVIECCLCSSVVYKLGLDNKVQRAFIYLQI